MKNSKLQNHLLQYPDDIEVTVDGIDIYSLELLPYYYDGKQEILIRDDSSPYYNVIGAKWQGKGSKIVIKTLSIEEALGYNLELPIDFSELTDQEKKRYEYNVEKWKEEIISINHKLNEYDKNNDEIILEKINVLEEKK